MADEKFGIDNLKKVAKAGIELGEEISVDLADKKISLAEGIGLLDNLMGIPDIVNSGDAIKSEFADLSAEERLELNNFIAEEFDIADDQLEVKIEAAIGTVVSIFNLVSLFKKPAA